MSDDEVHFSGEVEDVAGTWPAYIEELESERDALREEVTALRAQIDKLAQFIMEEVPGEPSQSEGAVDTAIRLLRALAVGSGRRGRE